MNELDQRSVGEIQNQMQLTKSSRLWSKSVISIRLLRRKVSRTLCESSIFHRSENVRWCVVTRSRRSNRDRRRASLRRGHRIELNWLLRLLRLLRHETGCLRAESSLLRLLKSGLLRLHVRGLLLLRHESSLLHRHGRNHAIETGRLYEKENDSR